MNKSITLFLILVLSACSTAEMKKSAAPDNMSVITSNLNGRGDNLSVEFYKGKSFYYPLMAVWIEDSSGKYIQSLFVPASVAKGIFKYGRQEQNKWVEASKRAPQTLPYWAHKRAIIASDGLYMPDPENPVADAYSGATPVKSFILNSRSDNQLPVVFRVLLEVNQNWDWNWYWTNDKYPDNENYKMSCQPALVYAVVIDTKNQDKTYVMRPIGHSHYSGLTGELFPDLSTFTTALNIADSIVVKIKLVSEEIQ